MSWFQAIDDAVGNGQHVQDTHVATVQAPGT